MTNRRPPTHRDCGQRHWLDQHCPDVNLAAWAITQPGYGDLELVVTSDGDRHLALQLIVDPDTHEPSDDLDHLLSVLGFRRRGGWQRCPSGYVADVEAVTR